MDLILCTIFSIALIYQINSKALSNREVPKQEETKEYTVAKVIMEEEKPKKSKSMLEGMRESGLPDFIIEHHIKEMEELGFDINDWIVVERETGIKYLN